MGRQVEEKAKGARGISLTLYVVGGSIAGPQMWYACGAMPTAPYEVLVALTAVALALSGVSLIGCLVTWYLSRAGRLRAYEHAMNGALTNANRRIETVELGMSECKATINEVADAAAESLERTRKERARTTTERHRAEQAGNGGGVDLRSMSRAQQLDAVKAAFNQR